MDLAGPESEVDALERPHAAEGFGNAAQRQKVPHGRLVPLTLRLRAVLEHRLWVVVLVDVALVITAGVV